MDDTSEQTVYSLSERAQRESHERELRIHKLSLENPDVRMLVWQRDSARVQLNLMSMAVGDGCSVPFPYHLSAVWAELQVAMSPWRLEERFQLQEQAAPQPKNGT